MTCQKDNVLIINDLLNEGFGTFDGISLIGETLSPDFVCLGKLDGNVQITFLQVTATINHAERIMNER